MSKVCYPLHETPFAADNHCSPRVQFSAKAGEPFQRLRQPQYGNLRCLFLIFMGKYSNKGGRPPQIEATEFRCSVNFSAREHAALLNMFEQSGAYSMSSFIKNFLFQKPFKVFSVDENTRIFINKLSESSHFFGPPPCQVDYEALEEP